MNSPSFSLECGEFKHHISINSQSPLWMLADYMLTDDFRMWLYDWRKARIMHKQSCCLEVKINSEVLKGFVSLPRATKVAPVSHEPAPYAGTFTEFGRAGRIQLPRSLDSVDSLEGYLTNQVTRLRTYVRVHERLPQYNVRLSGGIGGVLYIAEKFKRELDNV